MADYGCGSGTAIQEWKLTKKLAGTEKQISSV